MNRYVSGISSLFLGIIIVFCLSVIATYVTMQQFNMRWPGSWLGVERDYPDDIKGDSLKEMEFRSREVNIMMGILRTYIVGLTACVAVIGLLYNTMHDNPIVEKLENMNSNFS